MAGVILTLTMNPAIDGAAEAERVRDTIKVRTFNQRFDPGGGGINVARVLARLGSPTHACYLSGGATGALLDHLIEDCGFALHVLPIADFTRINQSVFDHEAVKEYRFTAEGPVVTEAEWRAALRFVEEHDFDWLVASGSLPRGAPPDLYARLVPIARSKGARLVVDSSRAPLHLACEAGGLALIKPNGEELEALAGRALDGIAAHGAAALDLVRRGVARIVVVTLGEDGAILADANGYVHCAAPPVTARSAVGAGDSFLAGMIHGLVQGWPTERAFRYGLAAGTAAVVSPGTDLCHKDEVERYFALLAGQAGRS